ncbi:unnamed protein product [Bemisia tabaci]|uniref:PH domain-containing protein n=1 Tax=Bemisia tabaci TaxID=7038 RepID=A0A9P0AHM8_BEMTA|nr:unnamed protein product [Bemisia tabaci]
MTSFSERMRLRAKASRESKDFASEKSFMEGFPKPPSQLPKLFETPNLSTRIPVVTKPQGTEILKPVHNNRPPPVPPKPVPATAKEEGKVPLKEISINNRPPSVPPKPVPATVKEEGKVPLKEISIMNNTLSPPNVFSSVKPVYVSPPKPGHLYPCLSGMEVETDSEALSSEENPSTEERTDCNENLDASISSLSSESSAENFNIVNMDSSVNCTPNTLKRRSDSSSSSIERHSILKEMDAFLENALCSDTSFGPSPAKSICNDSLETSISTSFTYQVGSPVKAVTVQDTVPALSHSVSFSQTRKNSINSPAPARSETTSPNVRAPIAEELHQSEDTSEMSIASQIKKFESLVKAQENIISQAAGALSVCFSSSEFTNSTQRVEAERLLLLASHKKKAILNEIEKLKASQNKYLKPVISNSSLTLSDICLPIKLDLIHRAAKANICHHLVVIVKSNEHVFGTPLFIATAENLLQNSRKTVYVKFPHEITIPNITPDFKVIIEVYDLAVPATPSNGKASSSTKKESSKLWITPKKSKPASKLRKVISRSLLKSSNFKIIGSGVFTLNDVKSSKITLTKMSVPSLLEGTLCFRSNCDVTASVEFRGFLTMFDDISGFGAWHRRWCLLSGNQLLYWKYPEDENTKKPIGSIDLTTCISRNISAASREICARKNTFLMECIRPSKPDDVDSHILTVKGQQTIVRFLLSADTQASRNEWCDNLNQVLSIIHQWN